MIRPGPVLVAPTATRPSLAPLHVRTPSPNKISQIVSSPAPTLSPVSGRPVPWSRRRSIANAAAVFNASWPSAKRRPAAHAGVAGARTTVVHGRCLDGPYRPTSSSMAASVSPSSPIRPCPHQPPEPRYRHRHERQRRRSAGLNDAAWASGDPPGGRVRLDGEDGRRPSRPCQPTRRRTLTAVSRGGSCRCPRGDTLHTHTPGPGRLTPARRRGFAVRRPEGGASARSGFAAVGTIAVTSCRRRSSTAPAAERGRR